jgi:hypothetical protein
MRQPLRANVYDKEMVSAGGDEAPAPLSASVIDATRDISRTLRGWAWFVLDRVPRQASGVLPVVSPAVARWAAECHTDLILNDLDRLVNDTRHVEALCADVLGPTPEAPGFWTVGKALARWPLEERSRWSKAPCPLCDLKAVRVTPPTHAGGPTFFRCAECRWQSDDSEMPGFAAVAG